MFGSVHTPRFDPAIHGGLWMVRVERTIKAVARGVQTGPIDAAPDKEIDQGAGAIPRQF